MKLKPRSQKRLAIFQPLMHSKSSVVLPKSFINSQVKYFLLIYKHIYLETEDGSAIIDLERRIKKNSVWGG